MPDLITHGSVALLLGFALVGRRRAPLLPLFVAGTLLPDVLARVPAIVFGELHSKLTPLPMGLLYGWDPMHQPFGMALAASIFSLLLPPTGRARAFLLLLGGMLLHLALDLLQFHEGAGHMLLFPFSERTWEIGVIGSEDSVLVAIPLALLAALVAVLRRRIPRPERP